MTVHKVRVSRFELLMDAGFGAQKAGDILISAFAHMGRYVYIEPMIPAEISPPARSRPAYPERSFVPLSLILKTSVTTPISF